MAINIGNYTFEGPYAFQNNNVPTEWLEDRSGVYVILDYHTNLYHVLDVGESAEVRTRIANHDRHNCWLQHRQGQLAVAVLYTPNKQQTGRMNIEQELRREYNPPCGER